MLRRSVTSSDAKVPRAGKVRVPMVSAGAGLHPATDPDEFVGGGAELGGGGAGAVVGGARAGAGAAGAGVSGAVVGAAS
jgi:hypothetical protein